MTDKEKQFQLKLDEALQALYDMVIKNCKPSSATSIGPWYSGANNRAIQLLIDHNLLTFQHETLGWVYAYRPGSEPTSNAND